MATQVDINSPLELDQQRAGTTVFTILLVMSFCHFLNDIVQSLLPAIYPILKDSFQLSFGQVGLITLTYQLTASLLQPLVGHYSDQRPHPLLLPVGMAFTLAGLVLLSFASSFGLILTAAALIGAGSAVFHPESSRMARLASGGQHGLAQSVFAVGGNTGSAIGPLLAAFIVLHRGRASIAWFSLLALLAMFLLWQVGLWYRRSGCASVGAGGRVRARSNRLSTQQIVRAILVLLVLILSKYFYLASLTSYYTFYLMGRFGLPVKNAQIYLFMFLGAAAAGTLIGGPIGDRIGRKQVIWWSILGVLPFSLVLPYANLFWTGVLSVVIGLIIASAFTAIIVYAQEMLPERFGLISGLFYGFAFGMGGLGAALLGALADHTSIGFVYRVCSFLPALGLLTAFLPKMNEPRNE